MEFRRSESVGDGVLGSSTREKSRGEDTLEKVNLASGSTCNKYCTIVFGLHINMTAIIHGYPGRKGFVVEIHHRKSLCDGLKFSGKRLSLLKSGGPSNLPIY